jgi:hypothetical protein
VLFLELKLLFFLFYAISYVIGGRLSAFNMGNGLDVITANLPEPVQVLLKLFDHCDSFAGSAFVFDNCDAGGSRAVPFPKLRALGSRAQAQGGFRTLP